MGLRAYIIRRTIYSFLLIYFVLTLNFLIFNMMPGSPLEAYINRPGYSEEQKQKLMEAWGLNKPLHEKYLIYIQNMFTWNFGNSMVLGGSVAVLISQRITNTLLIMGLSSILAIIVGTILGVIAAYKRGKLFDNLIVLTALTTYSLPTFWMGLIFQGIFSFQLKILPPVGTMPVPPPPDLFNYWLARIPYLVMPVLVLFLFSYGGYLLLTRACVLETITEDYVITARAKGLKERTVLFKHVLKNASLPIITNVALTFGFILSGAIITEGVFSYEGLGTLTMNAIDRHDVPIMQAIFYVIALCVIIANFIADLLYGVIDPRIKYG